ncbi:MAG: pyridoxamine 5'-phosphate oxidase [Leptospiraceae bacterium]|nr:pyridoxamine 5'-phosphate oxidase [Leptospiraceae bacterium]MCB1319667.1 pyridoxamine 5'-phosphate oxidase [Leptospiraceae bacterium]
MHINPDKEHELRRLQVTFGKSVLIESEAGNDPFDLFDRWFSEALQLKSQHPNAFTLATADTHGRATARVLLLKDYDRDGFVFYTNYQSRKGHELEQNPQGCILFFWPELEKQVRIEGAIHKVDRDESAEYFHSRPRESQLGAHASLQSSVLSDRVELEQRFQQLQQEYGDDREIPLPDYWGGYRLRPDSFEFWQGRDSRLHDRLRYSLQNETWVRARLSP